MYGILKRIGRIDFFKKLVYEKLIRIAIYGKCIVSINLNRTLKVN